MSDNDVRSAAEIMSAAEIAEKTYLVEKLGSESKCEISRTISQPRILSANI